MFLTPLTSRWKTERSGTPSNTRAHPALSLVLVTIDRIQHTTKPNQPTINHELALPRDFNQRDSTADTGIEPVFRSSEARRQNGKASRYSSSIGKRFEALKTEASNIQRAERSTGSLRN